MILFSDLDDYIRYISLRVVGHSSIRETELYRVHTELSLPRTLSAITFEKLRANVGVQTAIEESARFLSLILYVPK